MYVPTPMTEYVVTPMPDGTFSVWNEPKDSRYAVWQGGNGKWHCNCWHYVARCKKWGVDCKHIKLAKTNKKEELNDNYLRTTHKYR